MCGIAGIYAYGERTEAPQQKELLAIRDHMAARGPDGAGEWWSPHGRIGLGHRRLAIIDISDRAAQPMISADGRYTITFNGEIYNYLGLRRGLEARGCIFRTTSDTEVLLHLFATKGEAMVSELRGMFAFAIWDELEQSLLLARDPYGIKPLYYADDGRSFRFASQVKALMAGGMIGSAADPAALVGFCLFGSVPEPFTIYEAVKALPAGCVLRVSRSGARQPSCYFSLPRLFADAVATGRAIEPGTMQDLVNSALRDSVRHHLIADVPVGVFLSAGIDSAAIAGLAVEVGGTANRGRVASVTLGFEEFRGRADDEVPLAATLAEHFGTDHSTRLVGHAEFEADLVPILAAMDQPTIDGVNTWFVSKAARERGLKVALSGLGGDELFGGYPSFSNLPRWVAALRWPSQVPGLGRAFRQACLLLGKFNSGISAKAAGVLEYGGSYPGAYLLRRGLFMPWELPALLGNDITRKGVARLDPLGHIAGVLSPDPGQAFARVATLEASLYMRNQLLRDTDWASMAHSLEVRVPLVDSSLVRTLAPALVSGNLAKGKQQLADSPRPSLPQSIRSRPKTGFMTPLPKWLERSAMLRESESSYRLPARTHWSRRWALAVLGRFGHGPWHALAAA
jgi:asparagine synthase (glutamine-hydrolysing)